MTDTRAAEDDKLISGLCHWNNMKSENYESINIKGTKKFKKSDSSVVFCRICNQNVLDPETKTFQGLPDGALEEETALTDDRLQLYCDGGLIPEVDSKPLHKITYFTVFDGEGHLCPFDSGLIENDKQIFFSGYIKPIYDEDPSPNNGVPAQELGPIVEWWISGFDGGNSFLIAFRTPCAEYILMEPNPDYASLMREPKYKALLTKIIVEFLCNTNKPTYEDLLNRLSEVSVPEGLESFDENSVGKHSQFIIDQIREVDEKKKLESTPAVQKIIKMFKIKYNRSRGEKKRRDFQNSYKGVITSLVRRKFKFFFDCENPPEIHQGSRMTSLKNASSLIKLSKFTWEENDEFAVVNDEVVSRKDFVLIFTNNSEKDGRLFRIEKFFQQNFTKQVHCSEFICGSDTILGEASDPFEIFFLEECSDWPICKIIKKVNVSIRVAPKTWDEFLNFRSVNSSGFFIQKKYSKTHGSFEDFQETEVFGCMVCKKKLEEANQKTIFSFNGETDSNGVTTYDKVILANEEYVPGCCVYLEPFAVVLDARKSSRRIEKTLLTLKTDEKIYPEIYRKAKEVNMVEECPEPFVIGYVKAIYSKNKDLQKKFYLKINKFYRPENTRVIRPPDDRLLDLRLLFWSEEEAEVSFDHVRGLCDCVFSKTPPQMGLQVQFYFNFGFDSERETFYELKELKDVESPRYIKDDMVVKKLRTLNVFSGSGGLAEGLNQSEIVDLKWAVEIHKSTCEAYMLNFPQVLMFEKDANLFLRDVTSGKTVDASGNNYPLKGDVEFLCGGPPCQGFSTMNRFTSKEESQYNNSLIMTYFSFCDYYRPKFFLLENVRNFVSYKKSVFLKHALGCLIAMGYQCTFAVLQAGNYGLPQTRRRLFIIAAAPGYQLPYFPKPTNVFYGSPKNTECEVGGRFYSSRFFKMVSNSAPFRNVTIRDAIYDLPSICLSSSRSISFSDETYFKKFIMGHPVQLQDHISKVMSPLNEARIKHIPTSKGCDWRDLPNIRVRLQDGSLTNLLVYSHHDRKNGKSCCGLLRGVCGCASGESCDPKHRQSNTLIPWFLVHTANRNNNWSGLYGRLDWEGIFNTVTTDPEPSSKQGKVLHPMEDRTVSVRECARAQGISDSFKVAGTASEKFRQIGNAVPPPVARAIGLEIKKSIWLESKYQISSI